VRHDPSPMATAHALDISLGSYTSPGDQAVADVGLPSVNLDTGLPIWESE
jgi:hypothetical protein